MHGKESSVHIYKFGWCFTKTVILDTAHFKAPFFATTRVTVNYQGCKRCLEIVQKLLQVQSRKSRSDPDNRLSLV